jgi:hypothetical protein
MLNRAVKPRILNSEAGPTLPIGAECSAQSCGLGRMNLPRGRGHPIPTTDWAGPLEIFSFGSGPQRYLGAALGDRSAPPVTPRPRFPATRAPIDPMPSRSFPVSRWPTSGTHPSSHASPRRLAAYWVPASCAGVLALGPRRQPVTWRSIRTRYCI